MNLTSVITHQNFIFALCTFIDEFKRNDNKIDMIKAPPQVSGADKVQLCILAAVAHKLANEYNVSVPEWVYNSQYKMPYPVFAFETKNKEYQEYLLNDTPYEFASKNIFYGANAIERV